jgi:hypothetical protein
MGSKRHSPASSVSVDIPRTCLEHVRKCSSRKRAAAIGIVNGCGNVGSVYDLLHAISKQHFRLNSVQNGFLHVESSMGPEVPSIYGDISRCAGVRFNPLVRFVDRDFSEEQQAHSFHIVSKSSARCSFTRTINWKQVRRQRWRE